MMTIERHRAELENFEQALTKMDNEIMRDMCQCLVDGTRARIAELEQRNTLHLPVLPVQLLLPFDFADRN